MNRKLQICAALLAGTLLGCETQAPATSTATSAAPPAMTTPTSVASPTSSGTPLAERKPLGPEVKSKTGLRYLVFKKGEGAVAKKDSHVHVHYTGTLSDGTKFDSSLDRGQPIDFILGQGRVIAGWEEGIEGMKVGEQRRLIIPPDLGYGENGSPPVIPGGATLNFEVELVKVE